MSEELFLKGGVFDVYDNLINTASFSRYVDELACQKGMTKNKLHFKIVQHIRQYLFDYYDGNREDMIDYLIRDCYDIGSYDRAGLQ